jgi:hypothetical protein
MFSAVARHMKRLPSGVLSPLDIDQTQGVRVELNACFMLRHTTLNSIRDSFISTSSTQQQGMKNVLQYEVLDHRLRIMVDD